MLCKAPLLQRCSARHTLLEPCMVPTPLRSGAVPSTPSRLGPQLAVARGLGFFFSAPFSVRRRMVFAFCHYDAVTRRVAAAVVAASARLARQLRGVSAAQRYPAAAVLAKCHPAAWMPRRVAVRSSKNPTAGAAILAWRQHAGRGDLAGCVRGKRNTLD